MSIGKTPPRTLGDTAVTAPATPKPTGPARKTSRQELVAPDAPSTAPPRQNLATSVAPPAPQTSGFAALRGPRQTAEAPSPVAAQKALIALKLDAADPARRAEVGRVLNQQLRINVNTDD